MLSALVWFGVLVIGIIIGFMVGFVLGHDGRMTDK